MQYYKRRNDTGGGISFALVVCKILYRLRKSKLCRQQKGERPFSQVMKMGKEGKGKNDGPGKKEGLIHPRKKGGVDTPREKMSG